MPKTAGRGTAKTTGIADTSYFGSEAKFLLFANVRCSQMANSGYYLDGPEAI